jgi:dCMP deaminase
MAGQELIFDIDNRTLPQLDADADMYLRQQRLNLPKVTRRIFKTRNEIEHPTAVEQPQLVQANMVLDMQEQDLMPLLENQLGRVLRAPRVTHTFFAPPVNLSPNYVDINLILLKLMQMTNERLEKTLVPTVVTTTPPVVHHYVEQPSSEPEPVFDDVPLGTLDDIKMDIKHARAFMNSAYSFASCSNVKRAQIGALCVKDDNILCTGYNESIEGDHLIHAEVNCLSRLARGRGGGGCEDAVMFVTHAPCVECSKLIARSGIKTVVYAKDYRCKAGINVLDKMGVRVIKFNSR